MDTQGKAVQKNQEGGARIWRPFESLRREVERLFDEFDRPFVRSGFDFDSFWRNEPDRLPMPAVDVVEGENAYEISAELPGVDEKNVELRLSNGGLVIKGHKEEEKEEKKKDYYVHERHLGGFERAFHLPDDVDADKVEAKFSEGLLKITLPRKKAVPKPEKKIEVKST
jgi:HSP20 family protein